MKGHTPDDTYLLLSLLYHTVIRIMFKTVAEICTGDGELKDAQLQDDVLLINIPEDKIKKQLIRNII